MADTTREKFGRSAESIVDGGAGGVYHRAIILSDLEGAVYGAGEEFAYDETEAGTELRRLAVELRDLLERVSITEDAELSFHRVCSACGGVGKDWRLQEPERSQNECQDCLGRGYDEGAE